VEYRPRLIDPVLDVLLAEVPAILLVGPRAAGKTTTALRRAQTTVRLDREGEAVAFRADPDAALRGLPEPVLIDEWQQVPGVLGAVKRAVDDDGRAGRFLITGSVRSGADEGMWPGTGRLVRLTTYGLTVRERLGRWSGPGFLDRVARGDAPQPASEVIDLRGYVELALLSGFPEPALGMGDVARRYWLESYVEQLLTRDVAQLATGRDPGRLRRFLEAYALSTAGVVDDSTLYQAAGIDRRTALAYERLLMDLFAVEAVPAWTSNRLKRLVLSAKRYLVEPAMVGSVLRLDVDAVMRDGDLLGRLLESFVLAQLRPEAVVDVSRPRLFHVRQQQGRFEVDLLAELAAGRIVGLEVKADSGPGRAAARHLIRLRDELGERFVAGLVLHTGPRAYELEERIRAVPISAIWSSA
jgi:uncharacterized protein